PLAPLARRGRAVDARDGLVEDGRLFGRGIDQGAGPLQTAGGQSQPSPARQGHDLDASDASAHCVSFPVATSNFFVILSPATATFLPSGENDRLPPMPVLMVRMTLPAAASNRFSTPSLSTEPIILPSGE